MKKLEGNGARSRRLCVMHDLVFKTMLTSDTKDSREALRSLLSACTRREVSKVQVSHNDFSPPHTEGKPIKLDVHVIFNDGEAADLEMQMSRSNDDLKVRSTFYAAMILSGQSEQGKPYKTIKRVYQIFFLNFILFPQSDKIPRRYSYLEMEEHDRLNETTEIIFFELPKLEQRVKDFLDGKTGPEALREDEKWCIFLKYRDDERVLPLIEELCRKEEGIMCAEKALLRMDQSYEEFARTMAEVKLSMDIASAKEYAVRKATEKATAKGLAKGKAEGLAMGKAEGRTEGKAEGLAMGKAEGMIEIARKLKIRGRPLAEIAEDTGLSLEEISRL